MEKQRKTKKKEVINNKKKFLNKFKNIIKLNYT